jgi:hypothetical protein
MTDKTKFAALYLMAEAAGMAALQMAKPRPMVVYTPTSVFGNEPDTSKPMYYESEGLCGFAWVNVSPGNSPFANWLKKNGKARKAYYGGVDIWVKEGGQSVERKEAYANAFAKVLVENGIKAYASSRLD